MIEEIPQSQHVHRAVAAPHEHHYGVANNATYMAETINALTDEQRITALEEKINEVIRHLNEKEM